MTGTAPSEERASAGAYVLARWKEHEWSGERVEPRLVFAEAIDKAYVEELERFQRWRKP